MNCNYPIFASVWSVFFLLLESMSQACLFHHEAHAWSTLQAQGPFPPSSSSCWGEGKAPQELWVGPTPKQCCCKKQPDYNKGYDTAKPFPPFIPLNSSLPKRNKHTKATWGLWA